MIKEIEEILGDDAESLLPTSAVRFRPIAHFARARLRRPRHTRRTEGVGAAKSSVLFDHGRLAARLRFDSPSIRDRTLGRASFAPNPIYSTRRTS